MKKEEIHLSDVQRILFGETPPEFLLEVFIRTLIIYLAALFIMRWLGKRMSGQLTITELSVMIMMGAIISLPMQAPDRGILLGILILISISLFQRTINLWAFNNNKIEKLTQGDMSLLVKDGVIDIKELNRASISKQQLYATLRSKNIYQLGKIKRVYLEGCGIFSIYQHEEPRAGLPILPPDDKGILEIQRPAPDNEQACCNCGNMQTLRSAEEKCKNCGVNEWTKAVIE